MEMQHGSRPTTGAIGGLRKGCPDGPKRRYRVPAPLGTRDSSLVVTWTACPQTLIYIFRELARARRAGDATRG